MPLSRQSTVLRRVTTLTAALAVAVLVPPATAGTAAAQPTQVFVPATTGPAAPGQPGVATGVIVTPERPVTLTATGTANCSSDPDVNAAQQCADRDANGSGSNNSFQDRFFAPEQPAHSLLARVGDGPIVFVGTGPTEVTGTGELRLTYNDVLGLYGDNSGGFQVTVDEPPPVRAAELRYTGPTTAVLVRSALTVSGSITDVAGGTPSGRLDEAQLRFTVARADGRTVGTCTAPVRATSDTVGTGRCPTRITGPLAVGRYTVTVQVVEDGPYRADPARATVRLVSVG